MAVCGNGAAVRSRVPVRTSQGHGAVLAAFQHEDELHCSNFRASEGPASLESTSHVQMEELSEMLQESREP